MTAPKLLEAQVGADSTILARTSKLRVVRGVKAPGAELDAAATGFTEGEFLKQR